MSKKKSISEQVNALKPSIKRVVFDGKSTSERISTNEIANALNIRLTGFKRSIFLAALYELTNENVLQNDGYYSK